MEGRANLFIQPLIKERIGLELIDEDLWQIYFTNLTLGLLDGRTKRIIRPS